VPPRRRILTTNHEGEHPMSDKLIEVATTAPLLERARAAMRGRAAIETAIAEVAERLRQARSAIRPEEVVLNDVLATVLAGEKVPADLADRVLAVRRGNESAWAEASVLAPLQERLQERLTAVHRDRVDDALHVLATELDVVLTAARPLLAQLDNVNDAESAIATDRVQPWRQAVELAERHVTVRGAQRLIVAGALDPPDQARVTARVSAEIRNLVDDFGIIRDPDRHHPTVGTGANGADVRLSGSRIFSGRIMTDAHTDRPARVRPWLTGDAVEDLHFLARPDVIAWVPTIAQLTGARDEHEQRQQAEARAEHERRPGDEPQPFLRAGRRMPPPPAALIDRLAREELGDPV